MQEKESPNLPRASDQKEQIAEYRGITRAALAEKRQVEDKRLELAVQLRKAQERDKERAVQMAEQAARLQKAYNRAMDQRGEDIRLKLTFCNYEMKYLEYALSEFPDLEVLEKLFQAIEEVQKAMRDANEWIQRRLSNIDFEVLGYEVRDEWEALLETSNDLVNNGETLKAMLLEVKSHLET